MNKTTALIKTSCVNEFHIFGQWTLHKGWTSEREMNMNIWRAVNWKTFPLHKYHKLSHRINLFHLEKCCFSIDKSWRNNVIPKTTPILSLLKLNRNTFKESYTLNNCIKLCTVYCDCVLKKQNIWNHLWRPRFGQGFYISA